ncbi:MAG: DUF4418 family protein [Synergistaceae bacterium]|jgi:hypothetical protein|nr:DUF4418 family protein [Synergistaceae bacterium]
MKLSKSKALYGVIGALVAAAATIPLAIYHFVEMAGMKGMHRMPMAMTMDCERACMMEAVVGAAIVVISIASLFLKNAKLSAASSAMLLVSGIAAIAVPHAIGLCKSEEMACRYITAPTLAILGSAIIVLSLVRLTADVIVIRRASGAV